MKAMQRNRNNTIPEESASSTIAAPGPCLRDALGLTSTAAWKTIAVTLPAGGGHPARAAGKASLSKPECHKPREQPKEKPDGIAPLLEIDKGRGENSPLEREDAKAGVFREPCEKNHSGINGIIAYVKEKHKAAVSPERMPSFLAANGSRKPRAGPFPKKAGAKEQEKLCNDVLSIHMEKARNGEEALLFMEARFAHGCGFLGCFHCETRRFASTFSGRQRRSVLAELDFVAKGPVACTSEGCINKGCVAGLPGKTREAYGGRKAFLAPDNARRRVCKLVRETAESLGTGPLFLPPYSPSLNLIERPWKFMRNKLRRESFDGLGKFKAGIDAIVSGTAGKRKKETGSPAAGPAQLYGNYAKLNESTFVRPEKEDRKEKGEQGQKQGWGKPAAAHRPAKKPMQKNDRQAFFF